MFCYKCGKNVVDIANYCPYCGSIQYKNISLEDSNGQNEKTTLNKEVVLLVQSVKYESSVQ